MLLFFIVVVILGHNLGNSQVSVYKTIGPTLVYVLCFTRPRYQVSVYKTIGPLVFSLTSQIWQRNIARANAPYK